MKHLTFLFLGLAMIVGVAHPARAESPAKPPFGITAGQWIPISEHLGLALKKISVPEMTPLPLPGPDPYESELRRQLEEEKDEKRREILRKQLQRYEEERKSQGEKGKEREKRFFSHMSIVEGELYAKANGSWIKVRWALPPHAEVITK